MITLKEWMEVVDYRITEGSNYGWQCYGVNAYCLDSWDGDQEGCSLTITFDQRTQVVYEVQIHDYRNSRAYRMISPDYVDAQKTEAQRRGTYMNEAWDGVEYTDLEVDDDFIQKALAAVAGEDYDTRISVPVDFSDEDLLKYMKMAHERDMTFNAFVEQALREAIAEHQRDPEGMRARTDKWLGENSK